ncbi:hypothetical protein [Streptomyces sp. NPDC049040]|uniref:hypothetical protein n=1 Tax=Streptomyces sp. NPDC049040 TaxID=3365593 RepID=UPI003715580C
MTRPPSPRSTVVLYTVSATCAALGALLWIRDRAADTPPRVYGDVLVAEGHTRSAWRIWSQAVTEERLGLYLVAAGLALAIATRVLSARRD